MDIERRGNQKNTGAHEVTVEGVTYSRDGDGVWRYADTWIRVPGARDLTLTERFQPKLVSSIGGGEVERVLVSGQSIDEAPELLGWCLEVGTPVTDEKGAVAEVLVPYAAWRDHDQIFGIPFDPAHGGSPAERQLAVAERRVREAERVLEQATEERNQVLRTWSGAMTRQEAGAITGLSPSRIQQLIQADSGLPALLPGLRGATAEALLFFTARERGLGFLHARSRERMTDATFARAMERLSAAGLIIEGPKGWRLTPDGKKQKGRLRARLLSETDASEGQG